MRPKPTIEAFWNRVVKSPYCWLWQGPLTPEGYGNTRLVGECAAHRIAWVLENGPITDGLCVLHRCDVRACVNPNHLFLGTRQDNFRDMVKKGRAPLQTKPECGENHRRAKISEATARDIFKMRSEGLLQREIATLVGLSRGMVSGILNRHFWKCLDTRRA